MTRLSRIVEPNNLRPLLAAIDMVRDVTRDLREDASFLRAVARTMGPRAARDRPRWRAPVFPPLARFDPGALAGKRIAVVSSGGSGATAALVGVRRAFEEAGIEPVLISACSGSVLFASLWASGFTADAIARAWLELSAADYLDPDWRGLARALPRRLRGFGGLMRGDAIERTYRGLLGDRLLGDTAIPLAAVVWNIDRNQTEYLTTRATPALTIARAVRTSVSIPIMVEPVLLGGHYYGDGGIVDILPIAPLAAAEPIDLVLACNFYLPERFTGHDVTGWMDQRWSILEAAGQLRYAAYLALAREHVAQLGARMVLLEPVPHAEVRGARFYQSFLDRREWPHFMRLGHEHARAALIKLARGVSLAA